MSHSQFHRIELFILRHAWLNLWDKHMTTGRINQVSSLFTHLVCIMIQQCNIFCRPTFFIDSLPRNTQRYVSQTQALMQHRMNKHPLHAGISTIESPRTSEGVTTGCQQRQSQRTSIHNSTLCLDCKQRCQKQTHFTLSFIASSEDSGFLADSTISSDTPPTTTRLINE